MPIRQGLKGVQRRTLPHYKWTKAARKRFLEALGETCNVTAAAKVVGVNPHTAHRLRRRDPEFAGLWAEAIADGAQRLREEMIAHQLGQLSSGENPDVDAPAGTPVAVFDPIKALAALKAFEGFGDGRRRTIKPATQAEVDKALMARLEALALRMIAAEARASVPALPAAARPDDRGEGA